MKWDFNYIQKHLTGTLAAAYLEQRDLEKLADVRRILDIVGVMTPAERADCDLLIDRATRERIAHDAKASLKDVDDVIAQGQALATAIARSRKVNRMDEEL